MDNIVQINGKIIVNGIEITQCPSKSKRISSVIVGDKIYVNGYEFKDGVWKRTLAALLYNLL